MISPKLWTQKGASRLTESLAQLHVISWWCILQRFWRDDTIHLKVSSHAAFPWPYVSVPVPDRHAFPWSEYFTLALHVCIPVLCTSPTKTAAFSTASPSLPSLILQNNSVLLYKLSLVFLFCLAVPEVLVLPLSCPSYQSPSNMW